MTFPHWWLREDELPEQIFFPLDGKTIDELYASIEANATDQTMVKVWIQYNKEYHYPERFTQGAMGFDIYEFEVLDGDVE